MPSSQHFFSCLKVQYREKMGNSVVCLGFPDRWPLNRESEIQDVQDL